MRLWRVLAIVILVAVPASAQDGIPDLGPRSMDSVLRSPRGLALDAWTVDHGLGPDFGYVFEWLILRATDLGLATCWLGGTFKRGAFGQAVGAAAALCCRYNCTPREVYERHLDELRRGRNRFRWVEYSLSATLMIVLIALLTGITDRRLPLRVRSMSSSPGCALISASVILRFVLRTKPTSTRIQRGSSGLLFES